MFREACPAVGVSLGSGNAKACFIFNLHLVWLEDAFTLFWTYFGFPEGLVFSRHSLLLLINSIMCCLFFTRKIKSFQF